MDKDKNNRNRKKTNEDAEDILGMIRKRQEETSDGNKLRNFLKNLENDNVTKIEYDESPVYQLGYQDGFDEADEMWHRKMSRIRNGLKSILSDC